MLAGTDSSRSMDLGVRGMAFREVAVVEIREVLRAWLSGSGLRLVAAQAGVDRKTARRYVEAAVAAGLARDGGLCAPQPGSVPAGVKNRARKPASSSIPSDW